jgi:hypothetical protein
MSDLRSTRRRLLDEFLDGLQRSPSDLEELGLIPLSIAAEWIGSGAGKVPLPLDDPRPWALAYGAIVSAAGKGKIAIHGVVNHEPKIIPSQLLHGVSTYLVDFDTPPDAPFAEQDEKGAIISNFFIRAIIYPGSEEWLHGMSDALLPRIGGWGYQGFPEAEWYRLQVRRRDVRKLWRFNKPQLRTGVVGRHPRRSAEAVALYRDLGLDAGTYTVTEAAAQLALKPRTIERYIRELRRSQKN